MPCDSIPRELTEAQKAAIERRKEEALRKAEQAMREGKIKVLRAADGSKRFEGWPKEERNGWCDGCAYRRLSTEGSSALRMAEARSQGQAGQGPIARGFGR